MSKIQHMFFQRKTAYNERCPNNSEQCRNIPDQQKEGRKERIIHLLWRAAMRFAIRFLLQHKIKLLQRVHKSTIETTTTELLEQLVQPYIACLGDLIIEYTCDIEEIEYKLVKIRPIQYVKNTQDQDFESIPIHANHLSYEDKNTYDDNNGLKAAKLSNKDIPELIVFQGWHDILVAADILACAHGFGFIRHPGRISSSIEQVKGLKYVLLKCPKFVRSSLKALAYDVHKDSKKNPVPGALYSLNNYMYFHTSFSYIYKDMYDKYALINSLSSMFLYKQAASEMIDQGKIKFSSKQCLESRQSVQETAGEETPSEAQGALHTSQVHGTHGNKTRQRRTIEQSIRIATTCAKADHQPDEDQLDVYGKINGCKEDSCSGRGSSAHSDQTNRTSTVVSSRARSSSTNSSQSSWVSFLTIVNHSRRTICKLKIPIQVSSPDVSVEWIPADSQPVPEQGAGSQPSPDGLSASASPSTLTPHSPSKAGHGRVYYETPRDGASSPTFLLSLGQGPIPVYDAGGLPPWVTTEDCIDLESAAHQQFADLNTRIGTFHEYGWQLRTSGVDVANMALAGFFIEQGGEGDSDELHCFHCGRRLRANSLREGDNIWDEHVRQNPNCPYLVAVMGQEDIQEAQARMGLR